MGPILGDVAIVTTDGDKVLFWIVKLDFIRFDTATPTLLLRPHGAPPRVVLDLDRVDYDSMAYYHLPYGAVNAVVPAGPTVSSPWSS